MGHSQAEKALSRERILRQAADQARLQGLESISVGKLMRSVGLTHGGFYNHFESRSDLLAQTLARALADSGQALAASRQTAGQTADARAGYESRVRGYLSRTHRDARTTGCAIAALAADVSRADAPSRALMSAEIDGFIAQIREALGSQDDGDAMLAASAMVGALLLSRVQADPVKSDALLKTVRERLLALNTGDAA